MNAVKFVALRYLKSSKHPRLFSMPIILCLLAVAASVAVLIIVMSVMNGFKIELMDKILGVNAHATIYPGGRAQKIEDWQEKTAMIKNLSNEITHVIPIVDSQAMMIWEGGAQGILVRGISVEDLKSKETFSNAIAPEERTNVFSNFTGKSVLLGGNLAERMGVDVGDDVTVVSPGGHSTVFGFIPRHTSYKVIGTFHLGMAEYDDNLVIMPLEWASKLFNLGKGVGAIEVFVKHPQNIEPLIEKISEILPGRNRILDWQKANVQLIHALNVEKNVMFMLLTLFVFLSSLTIFISITMMVNSKARSMAILYSLGLTRKEIGRIFFTTGVVIGVIGTICGAIFGILVASNIDNIRSFLENNLNTKIFEGAIYFLSYLPSKIYWSNVISISLMAFIMCLIFSIIPARRATKSKPSSLLNNG